MTLFTAEAVLSAHIASVLQGQEPDFFRAAAASYARWLMTQENSRLVSSCNAKASWLLHQKNLFSLRSPGTTCLSPFQNNHAKSTTPSNHTKGSTGRIARAP